MNRRLPVIWIFLFISSLAVAQSIQHTDWDSSAVQERYFDTLLLQERLSESAFSYDQQQVETPNLFDRIIEWILKKLFKDTRIEDVALAERIIIWLAVLVGIAFLIFYVRKMQRSRVLFKDPRRDQAIQFFDYEGTSENLFEQWRESEAAKNYHLAMRYLFILCLVHLKEEGIIKWTKDKTNSDYLRELKNEWQKTSLTRLVRLFEYSQYGDYEITPELYEEAKALFTQMKNQKGGRNETH